jgi:hypothetical protein
VRNWQFDVDVPAHGQFKALPLTEDVQSVISLLHDFVICGPYAKQHLFIKEPCDEPIMTNDQIFAGGHPRMFTPCILKRWCVVMLGHLRQW